MARFSLNNCTFSGNLGQDPKTHDAGETKVATFSLGISRGEDTSWANVVAFGKTAERVAQYLHKGDPVIVVGRYQQRSYEVDGEKRNAYEFIADQVIFMGGKSQDDAETAQPAKAPTPMKKTASSTAKRTTSGTSATTGRTLTQELEEDEEEDAF